jgi:predicted DNA-binding protein (MmcQ/YjbR family)
MSKSIESVRERLKKIGAKLPEAEAEASGRLSEHTTFRVRKKTFAYLLVNHHGDGRVALCCKAAPGVQQRLIASDANRYFRPAYLGASGWIGFDFDGGAVDWPEVEAVLRESYALIAPRKLSEALQR